MQNITDQSSKCKLLLYHYHGTKGDLLVSFLNLLLSKHEQHVECSTNKKTIECLEVFVTRFLFIKNNDNDENIHLELLGMFSKRPFNDSIQLGYGERILRGAIADILEAGTEPEPFVQTDTGQKAISLVGDLDSSRTRQIRLGEKNNRCTWSEVRKILSRFIEPILTPHTSQPPLDRIFIAFDRQD